VVIAILVLLLKRIPPMILFYRAIPTVKSFKEALFVGYVPIAFFESARLMMPDTSDPLV
jgi:hypothetical protein